jgi:hypothetical protein
VDVNPGDVAARTSCSRGETPADMVRDGNDRYGGGFGTRGTRRRKPECDEDGSAVANQIACQRWQAVDLAIGAARLEADCAARDMAASGKEIWQQLVARGYRRRNPEPTRPAAVLLRPVARPPALQG